MSDTVAVDILVVAAKAAQERKLAEPLKAHFGPLRILNRPNLENLRQALAESKPRLLLCELDSHMLAIRRIHELIEHLKLTTKIIATTPTLTNRAVIRAMGQGARDLVNSNDPIHLQLVVARELGTLLAWSRKNASRLAPYVEQDDGHATLDGFHILDCDRTFADLAGAAQDALQNTSLLKLVNVDDQFTVKEMVNRCTQGDGETGFLPIRLAHADGTQRRVLASVKASYKDDSVTLLLTVQTEVDMPEAEPAAARKPVNGTVDPAIRRRMLNALKENHLSLAMQPIEELVGQPKRKQISKLDVFVMLKDADGDLPASKFIREARTTGLIRHIDHWVILNACKLLRANLHKEGPMLMFLRLSRQSLHDTAVVKLIMHEVKDKGIPPYCLSFELAQSEMNDLTDEEIGVLQQIKRAGCLLTIAGIGANQSAESLLRRVPADYLKLDAKLSAKAEGSEKLREQIREIVQWANETGSGVISTQVMSAPAMAMLWNLGVHYVQGNSLHEPEIVLQA